MWAKGFVGIQPTDELWVLGLGSWVWLELEANEPRRGLQYTVGRKLVPGDSPI